MSARIRDKAFRFYGAWLLRAHRRLPHLCRYNLFHEVAAEARALLYVSTLNYTSSTIEQAREARKRFGATGEGIVWALVDSGVDASHPQFQRWKNLELPAPLQHIDLTTGEALPTDALDEMGHGTHVAGIICGELAPGGAPILAEVPILDPSRDERSERFALKSMEGIAPHAKLLSLRVLDGNGEGKVSTIIRALEYVEELNRTGPQLRVHGVCVAVGYSYDVSLFACGQSPLCVVIDRLVNSGVVVVVPAGNTGFDTYRGRYGPNIPLAIESSINDPGNAELAITVGSAHRLHAEAYGVSYFSAKGPTLDGRAKPDLVAPGERVLSCAASKNEGAQEILYREDTGTSMAAAHVAGAVAALLSARRDLIGKPKEVKELLRASATDLRRQANYQGRGLLNLLAALDPTPAGKKTGLAEGPRKLKVMISYAHKDEELMRHFRGHLATLEARGSIEVWRDRNLIGGDDWRAEILRQLEQSDLIILLLSADFLSSEFCWQVEMPLALERHRAGTARVIPVLTRKVDIEGLEIARLQSLPEDFVPVMSRDNEDEGWFEVAVGIRRVVESITGTLSDVSPLVPGIA